MFFRHGADSEKHAAVRARGTNEAQLKELRAKARRRLIGALVLVLAAVIIVPWLFQEPVTDDTHVPAVVPATPAGLPPAPAASSPTSPASPDVGTSSGAVSPPAPAAGAPAAQGTVQPPQPAAPPSADAQQGGSTAETAEPQPAAPAEPAPSKPAPKAPPAETRSSESASAAKPAKKPSAERDRERTDDGSVALALLSGKAPSKSSTPAKGASGQGRYFLQVAAYAVEQDAQSRRDSLRQAGVTDAYVEKGQSAGRTVYRLRVGPFGSHEAAQAAQARLRALGYQNGLISAN